MTAINSYFELDARGSSVGRELRGATATFLTMAYILFANADILAAAGVPKQQVMACTALAAGICSILMGLIANFPIALASGMGFNAVVALTVAKAAGSWQAAMGLIVLDGIVTLLLVLVGLREAVLRAIPRDLRLAIGAGIGLFIAYIGLMNARIVVMPEIHGAPPHAGSLRETATWIALVGLLISGLLVAQRIKGALLIGIVLTTVLALVFKLATLPTEWQWPSFGDILRKADVRGALRWDLLPLLFSIIMVDFFDTLGTATAIAEEAKLIDARGNIPRVRRILLIDSLSASVGGLLGASSVTSYIESAAGVAEGARTGLHSVFVGIFFLLAILLAPLMTIVPPCATAPALILIGFLMISQMAKVDFSDPSTAIPAFLTLITIPLTYSIAHGIGYGFIAFVTIKLLSGKLRDVHPIMYATAAVFAAFFIWGQA